MNWHNLMNIPGPDHLREALTNCEDPLQAIEEFQVGLEFPKNIDS